MPALRGLALAGVIVLAGAIGASACSSSESVELDLDKAAKEIRKLANKAFRDQAVVGDVRCPQRVTQEKGGVFTCTVHIDGAPLTISVRQKDDRGNVRFNQTQAVIFTKKVEDFVASYEGEHGSPTSEVSCGKGKVVIRAPGRRISCTIELADGTNAVASLVVRDTRGKVGLIGVKRTAAKS